MQSRLVVDSNQIRQRVTVRVPVLGLILGSRGLELWWREMVSAGVPSSTIVRRWSRSKCGSATVWGGDGGGWAACATIVLGWVGLDVWTFLALVQLGACSGLDGSWARGLTLG
ncbi:hypothetical protein RchiOBHm_Chr6g0256861 [Rosa chinensis]|uniref:Uncharacterized protein n=1 Tax=Rosa chinensis TaxID=74649 RepID=A0A2P6PM84_ROSCH|nr:hypothetical protein RchiOBHm_Chr6g0256861 [Rosa chinensis]